MTFFGVSLQTHLAFASLGSTFQQARNVFICATFFFFFSVAQKSTHKVTSAPKILKTSIDTLSCSYFAPYLSQKKKGWNQTDFLLSVPRPHQSVQSDFVLNRFSPCIYGWQNIFQFGKNQRQKKCKTEVTSKSVWCGFWISVSFLLSPNLNLFLQEAVVSQLSSFTASRQCQSFSGHLPLM